MADDQPAIFRFFPELKEKIGWVRLETSVSPVERLENLGHDDLWIKRDDLVSSVYGGNKVRRLEFALADMERKGKRRLVTIGGAGTNHGLACAVFCRRLGIPCELVVFDQFPTDFVRRNLLLFVRHGARLRHFRSLWAAGIYFYGRSVVDRGGYFLEAGGSSVIGVVGAVSMALELAEQVEQGLCPEPAFVFCPTASNGTAAGLALGLKMAGLNTKVVCVRVGMKRIGPISFNTPATVTAMIQRVHAFLKSMSGSVPDDIEVPPPLMLHDYFGRGYGYPTDKGNAAIELLRAREGIGLDPVYSGKAFAALLDFVRGPSCPAGPMLFWHTFNNVDLSDQYEGVDYRDLPKSLHKYFGEG